MAYPTIKLKKSSVPGRVPDSSNLDYGELAINYADGKIYYKNSSNVIMGHIIDSNIQDSLSRTIANEEFAFRTTDSLGEGNINLYYTRVRSESDITDIVDSAYIRFLQLRYLDSANAIKLIDSAYVQARQAFGAGIDSADIIQLIDSAYVNARVASVDSASVTALIDSAYVNARLNRSLFLDSAEAINLINVYGFDSTNFNGMFAAKSTTGLSEGTNKYYTKVRFDSDFGTKTTTSLAEGINKYYTKVRFDSDFGTKSTTNLAEGTNKYYTKARADSDAKRAVSVTDAGGDGSLSYVPATGIITYTGPSASEVRAHFSGGLGIKINSGVVSLDSADSAVFAALTTTGNALIGGNLTIDGDFYVGGTTTTVTAKNLAVTDNMIYLNNAIVTTVSNAVGSGTAVVYTTIQDHNYQIGFSVTITGVNPSAYNLTNQTITAITTNSFTVANSAVGSFVSGGTARAQTSANPDLGFAFGYRDSSYHHGGFFRDATDGYFKPFHKYNPEPDSSVFINTADSSFALADIQANNFRGKLITTSIKLNGAINAGDSVGTSGYVLTSTGTASEWSAPTRGLTGGGTDRVFLENDQTVTTTYSITANRNAMTAGPVTINAGTIVTIPSGTVWTIV